MNTRVVLALTVWRIAFGWDNNKLVFLLRRGVRCCIVLHHSSGAGTMTDTQRTSMIFHHEKMARAFETVGKHDEAATARKMADDLR